MIHARASRGFTLVELLIVIVVIAILAAITIVAYGGVTNKAHISAVQSTLKQATTQLETYNVNNAGYPVDQPTAALKSSSDITLNYYKQSDDNNYCVDATQGSTVYSVTNTNTAPKQGDCTMNGLVSEWKLNGDATDALGGNNGIITGATSVAGQNGNSGAFQFNGNASYYMQAPDTGLPSGTSDRSLFAWVNFAGLPSAAWAMVADYGSTSTAHMLSIGVTSGGVPGCVGSNDTIEPSGTTLTVGTWYLLGCVVSNNGQTGTIYVNGAGTALPWPTPLNATLSGTMYIGQYITNNYFTKGTIDDVRVYNRALSAGEVQELVTDGAL